MNQPLANVLSAHSWHPCRSRTSLALGSHHLSPVQSNQRVPELGRFSVWFSLMLAVKRVRGPVDLGGLV